MRLRAPNAAPACLRDVDEHVAVFAQTFSVILLRPRRRHSQLSRPASLLRCDGIRVRASENPEIRRLHVIAGFHEGSVQPFFSHGMLVYLSDGTESLRNEETRSPVARASSAWISHWISVIATPEV